MADEENRQQNIKPFVPPKIDPSATTGKVLNSASPKVSDKASKVSGAYAEAKALKPAQAGELSGEPEPGVIAETSSFAATGKGSPSAEASVDRSPKRDRKPIPERTHFDGKGDIYENARVYSSGKKSSGTVSMDENRKKKGSSGNSRTKGLAVFVTVILMAIVIGCFIWVVSPKENEKKPATTATPVPRNRVSHLSEGQYKLYGVVLFTDTEAKTVTVFDVVNNLSYELPYIGSTKIYAKEGTQITASVLKPGDMLLFTVVSDEDLTIRTAGWPEEVWEKSKIDNLEIYPEENRMVIRGENYKYANELCIIREGVRTTADTLDPKAERYTIRGVGVTVYEIIASDKPKKGEEPSDTEEKETKKITPTPVPTSEPTIKFNKCSISNMGYTLEEGTFVRITGPEGAGVYLDDRFVGNAPCEFEKVIGKMEIALVYDMKSRTYSYEGTSDGRDMTFDFSDRFN